MEIITNQLILDRENARIILIGQTKAEIISCSYRDLDDCLEILKNMIGSTDIISLDAEDILSLNVPGKTVKLASASAKGEHRTDDVFRRAFLNMETIHTLCFRITIPKNVTLDEIENGMTFLNTRGILSPDATIVWSVELSEEDTDEVHLDAIIFS